MYAGAVGANATNVAKLAGATGHVPQLADIAFKSAR